VLPDPSVLGAEEELDLVAPSNIPSLLGRLCLRRMNRGRPLVTFPDHSPLLLPRLNAHG
jgi:hypothetical protein